MKKNRVKELWREGKTAVGAWLVFGDANEHIAQGFRFIGLSSDKGFLRSAASTAFKKVSEARR